MHYTLEFTEDFDEDLSQITWWYSLQREGLEKEFLQSFQQTILTIQQNPFICQIEYRQVRRSVLKRFPYKIYYKIYDTRVRLYGIFHSKRGSGIIKKRLK